MKKKTVHWRRRIRFICIIPSLPSSLQKKKTLYCGIRLHINCTICLLPFVFELKPSTAVQRHLIIVSYPPFPLCLNKKCPLPEKNKFYLYHTILAIVFAIKTHYCGIRLHINCTIYLLFFVFELKPSTAVQRHLIIVSYPPFPLCLNKKSPLPEKNTFYLYHTFLAIVFAKKLYCGTGIHINCIIPSMPSSLQ